MRKKMLVSLMVFSLLVCGWSFSQAADRIIGDPAITYREQSDGTFAQVITGISNFTPVGSHTEMDSIATATVLSPPATANILILQALSKDIRMTLDGTTPTSSLGFKIKKDVFVAIPIGTGTTITVIEAGPGGEVEFQWGIGGGLRD